jgi:phospholipid/cholesterol/gamma-HCH transport system substrate-binding protein
MAKRVSPTAIGAFVVGSVALLIVAIVILTSGRFFQRPYYFVCFFDGSLNGLKVGAPVKFRGVQVGTVTSIRLRLPPSEGIMRANVAGYPLPVVFELDEASLLKKGGTGQALRPGELDQMIKEGLRAQLATESILTGVLYIDLDVHPDTRINLVLKPGTSRYPEVPTIPTSLQQIQEKGMEALAKLDKVDLEALVKSVIDATNSIDRLASSPALFSAVESMKGAADNIKAMATSMQKTSKTLDGRLGPLVASVEMTSKQAKMTLAEMQTTLAALQTTIEPGSPLSYQLSTALQNLSEASTAIRQLADYLQRNPSALVRGRYVPANER